MENETQNPQNSLKTETQKRYNQLMDMEAVPPLEKARLQSIYNGTIKALNDYREILSAKALADWQKAERYALELITELWIKYAEKEETFPNALAVCNYLEAQGWRISKSSVYNHQSEGKIRPRGDGLFYLSDVEKYANTHLKRLDGSSSILDAYHSDKLRAEAKRAEAQAKIWTVKAQAIEGDYIPRQVMDSEFAKRIAVLKNDMETFAYSEAIAVIHIAEGKEERVPEVLDFLLSKFRMFLNHYAEERTVSVPTIKDVESISDEKDEEE